MTSSNACASPTTAASNSLTMTVNANVTPSVSIAANPGSTICAATNVTFTATPTNGGTPTYQWTKNGNTVGTNSVTYTDNALATNDSIVCTITSSLGCVTTPTATSSFIKMTINPTGAQPAAFTASSASVTAGQTGVVYTVPNDASVTYTWSYSGTNATINGTSNSVTVNFASNATSGTLSVTATNSCGTSAARTVAISVAPVFTAGDLAILVENTNTINNTASIVELNTSSANQTTVNSYSIPSTLRFSNSATSHFLSTSDDGSLLVFTAADTTNTSVDASSVYNRAVGTISFNGTFNKATTYKGFGGATLSKMRGASTLDNSTFFIGDKSGFYSNGSTTPNPTTNILSVKSFGGTVYALTATATALAVGTISSATGGTYTSLSSTLHSTSKSNDFYMLSSGSNGSTYDILYIIDNSTTGLISKYSLVSGVWVANGTYTTTINGWAITAQKNGSSANLYVVSGVGTTANNSVVKLIDANGYNAAINITTANNVTLYTATGTSFIKGIAFAPACNAPVITSVSSNSPVCSGNTLNLTSSVTGSRGTYSWTGPNGFTSSTQNPSVANATVAATGTYTLTVSNSRGTVSSTVAVTIHASPTASITPSGSTTFCAGGSVTLTSTASNSYLWSNGATTQSINATTGGNYTVRVTDTSTCSTTSAPVAVTVNTMVTPSVSIVTNTGNTICSGTNVTFTATPSNGGTTPSYQWKLNGANVGTNSDTYSNNTLIDGDQVICILTSNAICATSSTANSNTISISVSSDVTPYVNITSSLGTSICAGTNVLFTAVPTNGGTTPSYQWKLNGTNVGTNSDTYSNSTLTNQDVVTCVLNSSNTCASVTVANSNSLTITVNAVVTPSVTVAATPGTTICTGTGVTFTATPTNGGTPTYQWTKNRIVVGTNSATYGSSSLATNDTIVCTMTSNAVCATVNTVVSSNTIMTVNSVPATPSAFTTSSDAVNLNQAGVAYAVANDPSVTTYNWSYTGNGATINGSGNSISVNYSAVASNGNIKVTATNSCGTSAARILPVTILDATQGNIRITEYMYGGVNGEYVEFTNVSSTPVDMTGWSFDDNTRLAGSQNLTPFGIVQAGESVILTEAPADSFRLAWHLCPTIKVVGDNVNNMGRADEINLFNASTALVDRLTYDDQTLGGVRASGKSAWVSAAGLGINKSTMWTLSAAADTLGSHTSNGGDIGSPGKSPRATVIFDPCAVVSGGPSILIDVANTTNYLDGGASASPASPYGISGVINDPTDPASTLGINFTINDSLVNVNSLTVTATSNNTAVVPNANLILTGSGASRNVKITPASIGYASINVTVSNGTLSTSYIILYAASVQSATPTSSFYHTGMSDASDGIPLDDTYFLTGDDELNVLNVYNRAASGLPAKSYNYTPYLNLPNPQKPEVDLEASAKSIAYANRIYWTGSMSNSGDNFVNTPNRDRIFATNVTGTGATTSISVVGYAVLRDKLIAWGDAHGYDFTSSAADGINPKLINGFDIEGMVMGPDGTTMYMGMRAPLVPMTNRTKAVIAPILNFETWFNNGTQTGDPTFGAPIELDLGGRGIRDIIRLSNGSYIISAGDPAADDSHSALFKWNGKASMAPVQVISDGDGALNMEGIMEVHTNGQLNLTKLEVINDGGSTILYTDLAEAKQLSVHNHRKFKSDILTSLDLDICTGMSSTVNASGSTTFCQGDSVMLSGANNMSSYLWSNGETTQTIKVKTSGSYSVTATNSIGCSAASSVTNVNETILLCDVDQNHQVDNFDFLQFLGRFNTACTGCLEDINHDGMVDNQDFLAVLSEYNHSCH
jgi:hypothetical protein